MKMLDTNIKRQTVNLDQSDFLVSVKDTTALVDEFGLY